MLNQHGQKPTIQQALPTHADLSANTLVPTPCKYKNWLRIIEYLREVSNMKDIDQNKWLQGKEHKTFF